MTAAMTSQRVLQAPGMHVPQCRARIGAGKARTIDASGEPGRNLGHGPPFSDGKLDVRLAQEPERTFMSV